MLSCCWNLDLELTVNLYLLKYVCTWELFLSCVSTTLEIRLTGLGDKKNSFSTSLSVQNFFAEGINADMDNVKFNAKHSFFNLLSYIILLNAESLQFIKKHTLYKVFLSWIIQVYFPHIKNIELILYILLLVFWIIYLPNCLAQPRGFLYFQHLFRRKICTTVSIRDSRGFLGELDFFL